ncbi:MAG: imidazole glycerol phosphate synthase, glutamine amidotransferase subunit [Bdellovibrionales bacterium RIFOXYC1_FULL_54_43]|nr:MAG: imidazole glycerol phosphate synthase, glutamine amidotransferase subunit [Bdellovibrionales bacterium RIFOXYC1_FULL_54_43]OFZ83994.1 MAG: imidazole glycerol phosphate synthase, glutamine amidotransferase subunit [Bdellovibrionales bacterium RIFOXYD1_FULL_55_31]
MSKRIIIVDYQLGNLFSINNAMQKIGAPAEISSSPEAIASSDALIIPGVGAFGDAMNNMKRLGILEPIQKSVQSGRPLLGICLGLQLLLSESEEFGIHPGLGIIPGRVRRFPNKIARQKVKVPHVGWNRIRVKDSGTAKRGFKLSDQYDGQFMYFVHSFYTDACDPADVVTETDYAGMPFCSSAARGNVFGCQFHPEKSGPVGLRMLKEWSDSL